MSPQELLKETQRAIGGEEMLNAHQKLVDLWNEYKIAAAVSNRHTTSRQTELPLYMPREG